jgi:hypothetical protein
VHNEEVISTMKFVNDDGASQPLRRHFMYCYEESVSVMKMKKKGFVKKIPPRRILIRCFQSSIITVTIVFLGSENQLQTVCSDLVSHPCYFPKIRFRIFMWVRG